MSRGDRREDIFRDDSDRESFLQTLADVCAKTSWQVHAYCLMPNHFHLVVETPQPNLAAGMKWFLGTYTARFNRRHGLSGHVFSGRYKSLLVSGSGGYLRTVCDYVHLNPVRAKLVGDNALRSYRWSSFALLVLPPSQRPGWLRVDRLFGECGVPKDSEIGRRTFERRLEARRAQELGPEFQSVRRGWCLGDDQFRRELLEQVESGATQYHYGREIHEAAEAKAGRIIDEELRRLVWTEAELVTKRKGDPFKIQIARRLRTETTVTLQWIANRLHMGAKTHLSHLLYWARREQGQAEAPRSAQISRKSTLLEEDVERSKKNRDQSEVKVPQDTKIVDTPTAPRNGTIPLTDPVGVGGFDTSFD